MISEDVLPLLLAVAALVLVAVGALAWAGARARADALVAVARAAVQLVAVAALIGWIFSHPGALVPYLAVMLVVATATATRRVGLGWAVAPALAVAVAAGAATVTAVALTSGALVRAPQAVLPYAAQVIGGAMTAASLSGGRLHDDVAGTWSEVEGWLALGAPPEQAVAPLGRRAVARALVPIVDQTRSAGLVTLPGAFVGMLLGGAAPLQAAQLQLLVLVGMLAAQAVAAALTVRLLARPLGRLRPTIRAD
ncbi:ABC transporter permease [Georgenia sp. SYP-B2076]|uniref:ABC transporter permease n=1 Tax=Georgenia sp. SYP-B2076 TaxID=2495881 RepID=UPI0013E0725F|nr:ABC transporter permease [Georgenia sp. SYP-B2076]